MKPEIKILEDFIRDNPDPRELKRALAVKLALSGYAYRAIQEIVGITAGFITKWKQQFLSKGLRGIFLKYQGSKSYLTRKDREKILRWIINQKHWDVWEVETYILETYEVIFKSKQSYYKLLKEARISWQKGEKENPKQNSEEIERKNQEIASILKNKKEEIEAGKLVVYAIDECHLLWGDLIGYLWNFIKESPKEGRKIEEMPERIKVMIGNEKERQTYYGALNLGNPELVLESYSAGNGENTVDFLGRLQGKHIGAKLLIIWDGASYHRGEEMKKLLTEVNSELPPEDWQITCVRFATYAPEENPVEAIWLQLKNLLRRFYWMAKNFSTVKRLFKFFAEFKLFNFPNLKKYGAFSQFI